MATSIDGRIRANAWGRYYVSNECDGCGACAECAPLNIGRAWDGTYCAIAFQPQDAGEEEALLRAMRACPLGCLHDDGEA